MSTMTRTQPKTTRSQTQKTKAQPSHMRCATSELSIKERSVRPRQHLPLRSLGGQQRAGAVQITLTLHKNHAQFPVGTSKKRPVGVSQRACRRDVPQGTNELNDGLAEAPIRLNADRHNGVTGLQLARKCLYLLQTRRTAAVPRFRKAAAM
jgi:hypothetical protein